MNRTFRLLSIFGLFLAAVPLSAQNHPVGGRHGQEGMPERRRSALVVNIDARVLEEENTVVWNEIQSQNTIPGRPVGIKLVGSNVVVAVQFTPFIRRSGNVLVAQGQIWIGDEEKGLSYFTYIQTIPMEFDEPLYFFPLGTNQPLDSSIELIITVNPLNLENNEIKEE